MFADELLAQIIGRFLATTVAPHTLLNVLACPVRFGLVPKLVPLRRGPLLPGCRLDAQRLIVERGLVLERGSGALRTRSVALAAAVHRRAAAATHRGCARGLRACGTSARNATRWQRGTQAPPTSWPALSPSLGCERPSRPFNTSKTKAGTTARNITPSIGPDPINTNAPKAKAGIANTARTIQAFQPHNCSFSLRWDPVARSCLSDLPEPSLDKTITNPNRPT